MKVVLERNGTEYVYDTATGKVGPVTDLSGFEVWTPQQPVPAEKDPSVLTHPWNWGVDLAQGIPDVVRGAAGLAGMVPAFSETADTIAHGAKISSDWLGDTLHTDPYIRKEKQLQEALNTPGFLDSVGATASFLARNPSQVVGTAARAVPAMLLPAGALSKAGMSAKAAAILGEGGMAGGMAAADIAERGDGTYDANRLMGLPIGLATAGIARASGPLAARMGLGKSFDPDEALAQLAGRTAAEALDPTQQLGKIALRKAIPASMFREGILEELPQGLQEQALQNIAVGDQWDKNLGGGAVLGVATGAGMGGVFGARGARRFNQNVDALTSLRAELEEKKAQENSDWDAGAAMDALRPEAWENLQERANAFRDGSAVQAELGLPAGKVSAAQVKKENRTLFDTVGPFQIPGASRDTPDQQLDIFGGVTNDRASGLSAEQQRLARNEQRSALFAQAQRLLRPTESEYSAAGDVDYTVAGDARSAVPIVMQGQQLQQQLLNQEETPADLMERPTTIAESIPTKKGKKNGNQKATSMAQQAGQTVQGQESTAQETGQKDALLTPAKPLGKKDNIEAAIQSLKSVYPEAISTEEETALRGMNTARQVVNWVRDRKAEHEASQADAQVAEAALPADAAPEAKAAVVEALKTLSPAQRKVADQVLQNPLMDQKEHAAVIDRAGSTVSAHMTAIGKAFRKAGVTPDTLESAQDDLLSPGESTVDENDVLDNLLSSQLDQDAEETETGGSEYQKAGGASVGVRANENIKPRFNKRAEDSGYADPRKWDELPHEIKMVLTEVENSLAMWGSGPPKGAKNLAIYDAELKERNILWDHLQDPSQELPSSTDLDAVRAKQDQERSATPTRKSEPDLSPEALDAANEEAKTGTAALLQKLRKGTGIKYRPVDVVDASEHWEQLRELEAIDGNELPAWNDLSDNTQVALIRDMVASYARKGGAIDVTNNMFKAYENENSTRQRADKRPSQATEAGTGTETAGAAVPAETRRDETQTQPDRQSEATDQGSAGVGEDSVGRKDQAEDLPPPMVGAVPILSRNKPWKTTVQEMLALAKHRVDPQYREYAQLWNHLQPVLKDGIDLSISYDANLDAAGEYNPMLSLITIGPSGAQLKTLFHEMYHAATIAKLERAEDIKNGQIPAGQITANDRALMAAYDVLEKILVKVQKSELASQYGAKDVFELVSEAFANPQFREALKAMDPIDVTGLKLFEAKDGSFQRVTDKLAEAKNRSDPMGKLGDLFKQLVNSIKSALGLPLGGPFSSAFDQIFDITPLFMSSNTKGTGIYFDRSDVNAMGKAAFSEISDRLVTLNGQSKENVVLPLMEMSNLVRRYKDQLKSLLTFQKATANKETQSKKYIDELHKVLREHWYTLNPEETKTLGNLLNQSTTEQVWAHYGLQEADEAGVIRNAHLFNEDLSEEERTKNIIKHAELHDQYKKLLGNKDTKKIADAYTKTLEYVDGFVRKEFDLTTGAIREASFSAIAEVVGPATLVKIKAISLKENPSPAEFTEYVKQVKELVKGNLTATKTLTDMKNDIENTLTTKRTRKGPYFPLMRFGDYIVVGRTDEMVAAEAALEEARTAMADFRKSDSVMVEYSEKLADVMTARAEAIRKGKKERAQYEQAREDLLKFKRTTEYKDAAKERRELARDQTLANKKVNAMRTLGQKHYIVEKFENEADARKKQKELVAKYTNAKVERASEWAKETQTVSMSFAKKLKEKLRAQLPGHAAQIDNSVDNIFIHTQHDQSSLKHMLRRENIEGFNKDALRVLQSFGLRAAHKLSAIEYNQQINDSIDAMQKDAKGDMDLARVSNEVVKRHVLDMDFKETPFQDFLTSITQAWVLGASPTYILQQTMQNIMIGLPFLSSRIYNGKSVAPADAMAQMTKEVARSAKFMKYSLDKSPTKTHFELLIEDTDNGLSPKEREMLRHIADMGRLDILMDNEIFAGAKGKDASGFKKFLNGVNWTARQIETANRLTAALATYNLATQRGVGHEKAMDAAADAVEQIHIDYSNANAPRYLKRNAFTGSKVVMQFKKYQLHMIGMLVSNFKDAYANGNLSAEEKTQARKFFWGLMTTHGMMGGALGLPLAAPLLLIFKALASLDDDDDEIDPEIKFKEMMASILDEDAADVVVRGLPALIGIDMHGKLGLGNVFSPIPFVKDAKDDQSQLKEYLFSVMGPSVSTATKVGAGLMAGLDGDMVKMMQYSMPKFAGDVVKGWNIGDEGIQTANGNTRIPAEKFSAAQIMLIGAGVPLVDVNKYYEMNSEMARRVQAAGKAQVKLKDDYVEAKTTKEIVDVMNRIRAYNARHTTDTITMSDLGAHKKAKAAYQKKVDPKGMHVTPKTREHADFKY